MLMSWLRQRDERQRLATEDARLLIARFGVRASHVARRRLHEMDRGSITDANRPPCHWRRVFKLTRQLLPYDDSDAFTMPSDAHLLTLRTPPPATGTDH
jgi:hypothetical protein